MKVAFITRSTLHTAPGGDTIQVLQTAKCMKELGIEVDIRLTSDKINYQNYDLLHFININRPSDILFHIDKANIPFVLTPILIDYSEYDKNHREGISGIIFRQLSANMNEYAKTFGRWVAGKDVLQSKAYIWKGQLRSIREILKKAAFLLPNSEAEYQRLEDMFEIEKDYAVVPNGIDPSLFCPDDRITKDDKMVLCAARIEGIKNQLNLIRALNNTDYTLMIVGSAAPNQRAYYEKCRRIAAPNIIFSEHVPQQELVKYYKKAKVHALPSWFETCGLSSLEAAAMGCNVAITEKGYTREYFADDAFYCDPGDPESIFDEVEKAAKNKSRAGLQQNILNNYTWQRAARITSEAYKKIIPS